MTPEELDKRWTTFRTKVFTFELPPEELVALKLCFVSGMIEMYGYMINDIADLPEEQGHAALDRVVTTMRSVSTALVREGYQLLGEDGGH